MALVAKGLGAHYLVHRIDDPVTRAPVDRPSANPRTAKTRRARSMNASQSILFGAAHSFEPMC